jgi:hypothetical protein
MIKAIVTLMEYLNMAHCTVRGAGSGHTGGKEICKGTNDCKDGNITREERNCNVI